MSAEENKELMRHYFSEVFSKGNLALAETLIAPDYVNHGADGPPGGWPKGPEGTRAMVGTYRGAFPDINFKVEDQVASGDMVVTRFTATGTFTGPLAGMPPTGKSAVVTGISMERIAGGQIAETWVNFDQLGLLQQIGLAPRLSR